MILYCNNKEKFHADVSSNEIDSKILSFFKNVLGHLPSPSEIASWRNSLSQMHLMLEKSNVPADCLIAIEYILPNTAKRIDFILSGQNEKNDLLIIIIELKQWDSLELSDKQDIVKTFIGGAIREVPHPSYQAWSYGQLLRDFSVPVNKMPILIYPIVYMHNLNNHEIIKNSIYLEILNEAPVFLRNEVDNLRNFVSTKIKKGGNKDIIKIIEKGEFKPSKKLADCVSKMLAGDKEFFMIDEQKIVYETIKTIVLKNKEKKTVFIIKGGPGTGKSVVAINLLVDFINSNLNACYVSKNAAPRDVYKERLSKGNRKKRIDQLFKGSGCCERSVKTPLA